MTAGTGAINHTKTFEPRSGQTKHYRKSTQVYTLETRQMNTDSKTSPAFTRQKRKAQNDVEKTKQKLVDTYRKTNHVTPSLCVQSSQHYNMKLLPNPR